MAYQPKSYRKFVATAATATLVASAVTPAFAASDFSDVSSTYKDAVNYLVENNIAKGTSETTFGTNNTITRGDAAVMIANALKLDVSDAPESSFTDLNSRVKNAVNALYAKGIINGKSATKFEPNANITRVEMAKVVTLAYGLEAGDTKNEFTDVNSTFDPYVDALLNNNITLGITGDLFGATQDVTRGQFALFMYRGKDLLPGTEVPATPVATVESIKAVNETTMEVVLDGEVTAVSAADFKFNNGLQVLKAEIKTAAAAAGTKTTVVLTTSTQTPGQTYSLVSYKGETVENVTVPGYVAPTPEVTSVTALNLKQFTVTFNQTVDKTSAEDKANYQFNKTALAGGDVVKLNEDGKSVTVTLASANTNQDVKEVAVKDVKNADGVKVSDYKVDVTFLDLTIPTVVSAKQIAPNEVQVFFSEPVQGTGFLIDGGKYSATVKSYDDATNSVILTTGTLENGEHTITVNTNTGDTVRDYAGLKLAKSDVKFTVAADTTAPTLVSAEAKTQTEVVLTFSEQIDAATLGTNVYHTAETAAYKASTVTPVAGSNGTQFTVAFSNPIPAGTATFLVSKEAAKDNFSNKNSAVLQVTAPVAVDTVKPAVTGFKYIDTKKAEITLSEEVTGADVRGNFKVTDKDGKAVDFTISGYTDKDKKLTINFTSALKEGAQYKLEVTGLKDKAVVPNEMLKYTNTFTATDVTGPTVSTTGIYNTTDRTVTVFFNEPVDGTTALDKSKYTLRYASDTKELALPTDATVSLGGNNTSVTIKLPTTVKDSAGTDISSSISGLVVGQVKDVAGNNSNTFTLVGFAPAGNLGAADVITGSAKTTDTRTVQFEVDTPLKSIVAADFTVNAKNVEFATFENKTLSDGSYGALVTLKVAEVDKWATAATPAIATKAITASKTLYDGGLDVSTSLVAAAKDGVAPAVDKTGSPAVDNVVVKDNKLANGNVGQDGIVDTIEVAFTEALKVSTVSIDDFQVSGYEVKDLTISGGNTVALEVKQAGAANMTDTFVVKLVGSISDTADNVLAASTTEYKSIAVTVPAVTAATLNVATGVTAGTLTTQEYSVDGGTTWTTFGSANETLGASVLASLDATKDFKVRVKATASAPAGAVQTIDVLAGPVAPTTTLNVATGGTTGTLTTQEYSVDGGATWTTFSSADATLGAPVLASLDATKDFKVRVKATSTTLAGAVQTIDLAASTAITVGTGTYTQSTDVLTQGDGNLAAGTYLWRAETSANTWSEWQLVTLTGGTPWTVGATKPGALLKVELKAISGTTSAPSAAVQITSAD
ncbi:hypothetical protein BTO30_01575 [Domibacillus antri]|uniref:SLH domain-containing protein n=1 Tax=Domibacillus antri TaxID=1714264 RepID=A0A1Q8Q9W1_9BACI|nr:S-layer homology domain-containing protein [Domibacillus antri]OLN24129.1 hypothetical protein BTO30_01575 [Domibacillus antri]